MAPLKNKPNTTSTKVGFYLPKKVKALLDTLSSEEFGGNSSAFLIHMILNYAQNGKCSNCSSMKETLKSISISKNNVETTKTKK